MQTLQPRPADSYSPLYFLASLGAGGLTVTFFMYLMFWVPHPDRPVPVFEDLWRVLATDGATSLKLAIATAMLGIAFFVVMNLRLLAWNLSALRTFRKTEAYTKLRNSNADTTLLAGPLAAAMSINALFIVGLVFVPNLWMIVEFLFPVALLGFLGIGIWAFKLIGAFFTRILTQPDTFDTNANNSFAQLLPAFALSMIAVGLAAPAAMSANPVIVGTSLLLSTFFGLAAILMTVGPAMLGFSAMLQNGIAREAGPTLMIIVPIMTVLGIMALRQSHGLHTAFGGHTTAGETMVFLARLLSVQILFLLLGLGVLRRQKYFDDFVLGTKTSPGSYALICPGVALSVMLHFFINKGLVAAGMITKFGMIYWSFTALALALQVAMILLVLRLNRQHFSPVHAKPDFMAAE